MKARRHPKVGLPGSCDELGWDRAYAKPTMLVSHYNKDHPSQGPNRQFPCGKCAHKLVQNEKLLRHEHVDFTICSCVFMQIFAVLSKLASFVDPEEFANSFVPILASF